MATNENKIITQGKFDQKWLQTLIWTGLGILTISASLYFLFLEGGQEIYVYPLLGGVVFLMVGLIYFLRQGKFTLTPVSLFGSRRVGGKFEVDMNEACEAGIAEIELKNEKGKLLRRLHGVRPEKASGIVWCFVHYKGKIPMDLIDRIGEKPPKNLPEGVEAVRRVITKSGQPDLEDSGLLALHEGVYYYVPESRTESPGNGIELFSPVTITQFVQTPGIPNRYQLPMRRLITIVLASFYPEEDKFKYLKEIVHTHLGSIVPESQKNEGGNLVLDPGEGTAVKIVLPSGV